MAIDETQVVTEVGNDDNAVLETALAKTGDIDWDAPTTPVPVEEVEDTFYLMENGETFQFIDPDTGEVIQEEPKLSPETFDEVEQEALKFDRQYYYHKIKEVGLQAQYDAEKKAIDEKYQPQIKKAQASQKWLSMVYQGLLKSYAMNRLAAENAHTKRPKKSTFIGKIKVGFRVNPAKTDVVNSEVAVNWLKKAIEAGTPYTEVLQQALKVEERVLVSHIPDEVKLKLVEGKAGVTGIIYHPSTETFKVDI